MTAVQRTERMFILDGDEPLEVFDVQLWADFMSESERTILLSEVHTPVRAIEITTFFLGADVFVDDEGPFQFHTRTDCEGLIRPRWSKDRRSAEAAHAGMVAALRRA